MIGDVWSDLGVHKGPDTGVVPVVIPDMGHHDGFPGVRKKMCKEHSIFLCLYQQSVGNAGMVHVPMG